MLDRAGESSEGGRCIRFRASRKPASCVAIILSGGNVDRDIFARVLGG